MASVSRDTWLELMRLLERGPAVVLTGAGVSTDSGVPCYRDENGNWKGSAPMQFTTFTRSPLARQKYWARSYVGFGRIMHAQPNAAHHALAHLERSGRLKLLVTQNVDTLHQRAGSEQVLDLHGRLDQVVCLTCGSRISRHAHQRALEELNDGRWTWQHNADEARPDGDVELGARNYEDFAVPACSQCGGVLKPDVVFFGERVPPERHARANAEISSASLLLVAGSSLTVNSGYRLVRTALQHRVPVVLLNRGVTRADDSATLKLEGNAGELLQELVARVADV